MRIAIVTGASSGMGREFSKMIPRCYNQLDELWIMGRNLLNLEALKETIQQREKISVKIFTQDLRKESFYEQLEEELKMKNPDVRMLVNAAGFGKSGMAQNMGVKEQTDMVDVNCRALTRITLLCLPYCGPGTRIINLASASAFSPQPGFAVYSASKAYVLSFSRALREEVKADRIYVTAVCPGPVDTAFFDVAGGASNPLKKAVMAKPEEVVKQALLDVIKGKELSVYGKSMKITRIACKILPHSFIVKIMGMLAEK